MTSIDRRLFLRAGLGAACSAAAFPLATPVLHAATPGDNRLVVIILRGGLDGLDAVQPYGDPDLADLRPTLARRPGEGLTDLDGFYGLHQAFDPLLPLWQDDELAIAHAVATPYRGRRSHFDGQDALELGAGRADGDLPGGSDGWLNRTLGLLPNTRLETAMAIGREHLLILEGKVESGAWAPTVEFALQDDERRLLSRLYREDPLFLKALEGATALSDLTGDAARQENGKVLGAYAARVLNGPSRIAAFSIGGWDTHSQQKNAIRRPAKQLSDAMLTLKKDLGRNWSKTLVVAMTEFGRTARENGNEGSDHGTGGIALMAGGVIGRRQVMGRWPGLTPGDLLEDRDLMPTEDVRRYAGWGLVSMFGLPKSAVERDVFPGLDLGDDPRFVA